MIHFSFLILVIGPFRSHCFYLPVFVLFNLISMLSMILVYLYFPYLSYLCCLVTNVLAHYHLLLLTIEHWFFILLFVLWYFSYFYDRGLLIDFIWNASAIIIFYFVLRIHFHQLWFFIIRTYFLLLLYCALFHVQKEFYSKYLRFFIVFYFIFKKSHTVDINFQWKLCIALFLPPI